MQYIGCIKNLNANKKNNFLYRYISNTTLPDKETTTRENIKKLCQYHIKPKLIKFMIKSCQVIGKKLVKGILTNYCKEQMIVKRDNIFMVNL